MDADRGLQLMVGGVSAVVGCSRQQGATDLTDQRASRPKLTSCIQKGSHLSSRRAIPSWRTQDNCIGLGESLGVGNWDMCESFSSLDGSHLSKNVIGERLCNLEYLCVDTCGIACAFSDGFS